MSDPEPWSDIPQELKDRRQWVIWREEERDGKLTKVPYRADRPEERASSTKPSTWATFTQAVATSELANGIGYVFAADDPYVGVDFDEATEDTRSDIRTLDSYTEHSQSGRGFHVIVKARLTGERNRRGHFEVYEQGRYFVMTGRVLKAKNISRNIEERQDALEALIQKHLSTANGNGAKPAAPPRTLEMGDHDLLERMLHSKNGPQIRALLAGDTSAYASASEADAALCCHLAFWTGNDYERILRLAKTSGLYRDKWEREDYAAATIKSAIGRTTEIYEPPVELPPILRVVGNALSSQDEEEAPTPIDSPFIHWPDVWGHEDSAEWVFDDVLARGRGHAIYAGHKIGKSLLCLYVASVIATKMADVVVIYLDYEMTLSDIVERMEDMGFGPHADLSRLKYALIPTLPPLDTPHGSLALMQMVDGVAAEYPEHHVVVIIDTVSRAVQGEENSADTFRDFYRHTGMELKRRGITWARLDHGGKDDTKGQRGSSAKGDDVDVVWQLKKSQSGIVLQRDVARMSWVPEKVTFKINECPLEYIRVDSDWPAGTHDAAAALDRLGVSIDISSRTAQTTLATAGEGRKATVVRAAVKWRQLRAQGDMK